MHCLYFKEELKLNIDEIYSNISHIEGWFEKNDIEAIASIELPPNPIIFECGTSYGRSATAFGLMWPDAEIHTCDPLDNKAVGRFTFYNQAGRDVDWHKPIDLLFIDDDHTYETIKENFNKFEPFIKNGGFVVLHDVTNIRVEKVQQEVKKFVDELGKCQIYSGDFGVAIWKKIII